MRLIKAILIFTAMVLEFFIFVVAGVTADNNRAEIVCRVILLIEFAVIVISIIYVLLGFMCY